MRRNEPVAKIMTTDVKTVEVGDKISNVRKMLTDNAIHHVPVVEGSQLVGMISSNDVMRISYEAYGVDAQTVDATLDQQFTIDQVMEKELVTIRPQDTVRDAANILSSGQFHSIPVVEGDNELAGIVTSTDLINYLVNLY